jgi:hypothetical protein
MSADLGDRLMQAAPDGRRAWVVASERYEARRSATEQTLSDDVMRMFGVEDGEAGDVADQAIFVEVEQAEFAAVEQAERLRAIDDAQRDKAAEKLYGEVDRRGQPARSPAACSRRTPVANAGGRRERARS